jgi:two-component system, cell cycle response regulator DivK
MTILVADDNLASRELMRELLEASGHRVVEATNGREALDLIDRDPPDVVFLDLQMPVLDGFCVVRQLRSDERFRRLPAVAVTASAMLGDRELAIAAGFDSYITKPINLNEVRKQAEQLTSGSYHSQN